MAVEDHSDEDKTVFARSDLMCSSDPSSFGGDPDKDSSNEDEDLTSLAWLQDTNLLRNFRMGTYGIEGEGGEDSPSSDCMDEAGEHVIVVAGDEEEECEQNVEPLPPAHSPYDPSLHSHSKPPFSFSCLIFMAIEDSPRKALPVKDIYGWILERFPYFQGAPTGWKNSVRHNLSLSKCFRKVDKEKGQNVGKGSLWCIDPEFRPNLLQALQKAPSMANLEFSHFSCSPASSPFCHNGRAGESDIKPCLLVASQEAIQIPSPELFPFLSRRLASSMKDPEVDAAATMLTLKNGPAHTLQNVSEESENDSIQNNPKFTRKRFRLKQSLPHGAKRIRISHQKPVITSSPSEDHTYSACLGDSSGGGRQNGGPPSNNAEEEGAHALMNLAEIASKRLLRKPPSSAS